MSAHTLLTQRSQSGLTMPSSHSVETHQGNELTRNLSGYARPQSSQLAEPLLTDSWHRKSGTGRRELVKKEMQTGIIHRTFLYNPLMRGKSHE